MESTTSYDNVCLGLENGDLSCEAEDMSLVIDHAKLRYPFCIVWTPIPILTWLFPVIGHMGIATSKGIIRDFAGPYVVSEDRMAFGNPTKYWQLIPSRAKGGISGWDSAVFSASEEYKTRVHNLCFDNCHSHVAHALTLMNYNDSKWDMVRIWFFFTVNSSYISFMDWIKTWLPFLILASILICLFILL